MSHQATKNVTEILHLLTLWSSDLPKIEERNVPEPAPSFLIRGTKNGSLVMDALPQPDEIRQRMDKIRASSQSEV